MAKFTINIVADNSRALQSVAEVQQKLNDIERHPIEIKIDANGNTDLLKQLTKLEQAKARAASANAKIVESENKVKIARAQTRTETAKAATEEKKAETAKRQATLETKKATTAEKQRQVAIERATEAEKKQALQEERTNTKKAESEVLDKKLQLSAEKRAQGEKKATNATKELGEATEKTAKKTESLWDNFKKFARWYIIGNAFSGIVRSMKDALETMKAVDDELVTIRKVTGFSNEQIAGIKEQAYSNASKYGVGAADYLESVAAFSRAGYKEQAAALAELSTKTQIVGDTTAEVANQFLLSVDAAYQYKGSIEQLTRVLDGANEIDNKYATSIEKIAEGMGIVAPVASQMHVTVDELAASIGTITAVTQRSGSEAARALRALFLNIVGDTKTEIDEGVTWTTGEIAGLRDVIRQYAPEAYKAAEATKSVIDPMEAIGGLAKSMQDGLLTEQRLMEMVSDIGGKLRTSQLLALIQNWDMYQSMLQDYAGAVGSADKEVENALDSWTRKTNQLKNAWAEFVSHLVDSGEIKTGIDIMIGFVKVLDSGVGKVAAFTLVIAGLAGAIAKLISAVKDLNLAFMSSPMFLAGAAAAAIGGFVLLVDKLNVTYDEQKKTLEDLQAQYDELYGDGTEIDQLRSKTEELTDVERNRLAVLEAQSAELEKQIKKQKEQTFLAWRKEQASNMEWQLADENIPESGGFVNINATAKQLTDTREALAKLNAEYESGKKSAAEYKSGIQALVVELGRSVTAIKGGVDAGVGLETDERKLLEIYNKLVHVLAENTENTKANTQAKEDNADASDEAAAANDALKTAFEEVDKNSTLTYGTLEELEALYPGLSSRILDANGNLTAEGQAALSTRAAFTNLIGQMIAFNNTGLNVADKISQLQALARQAGVTGSAVLFAVGASQFKEAADAYVEIGYSRDEAEEAAFNDYYNYNWSKGVNDYFKSQEKITAPLGGGGGGSTKTDPAQEYLNSLKQIVEDEKARYNLMEAQGASGAELAAQAKVIQEKLHDQAEQMREMGASYSDVTALSTEWWTWQEKIAKLLEEDTVGPLKEVVDLEKQRLSYIKASGASEEEQIAQMRLIQESLKRQEEEMRRIGADEKDILSVTTEWYNLENEINDIQDKIAEKLREDIAKTLDDIVDNLKSARQAMLDPLQAQLDALIAAHDATEERREEEEKIAAVQQRQLELEKARIALENAQRERTVRQYNARSGQWEWVANAKDVEAAQKNVETAQKNLIDAQTALAEYYADKEYEAAKANIEKQIENTNNAFDALSDAIEEAAQAIRDGKMSYEDAYAFIKDKMKEIYTEYGVDLTDALDTSMGNLTGALNDSVDGLQTALGKIKALIAGLSSETQASAIDAADIIAAGEDAANGIALFTQYIQNALETNDPESAIKELSDAIRSGIVTNLNDVGSILAALNGEYAGISASTAKLWALTKMQANSIAWHMTSDAATQAALHAENVQLGTAIGLSYNSATGTWHDASGQQVYTLNAVNGAWSSTLNDSTLGGTGIVGTGGSSSGEVIDTTGGATFTQPNGNQIVIDPLKPDEAQRNESYKAAQARVNGMTLDEYKSTKNSGSLGAGYGNGFEDDDGDTWAAMAWSSYGASATGISKNSTAGKFIQGVLNGEIKPGETLNATDGSFHYFMEALEDGGVLATHGSETLRFFDRGGILRGRGGIKATTLDEMVLPPAMTANLLNAEMNGSFDALLNHLGIITSAANAYGRGNIGSQHNGDVYEMNGVTISEGQARVMTVYDLAQLGKSLALHRGS